MRKISYLLLFIVLANTLVVSAQNKKSKSKAGKPNIIFILADDLGIGNVSCYGADFYKTPQIDQLAKNGMRFNHAYTAPLCGPSRALIVTGRYAFRTGAVNQDQTAQMDVSKEVMIPAVLKPAGYVSSMIGKWGQLPTAGPSAFGFDDYIDFKGSGVYWNKGKKATSYIVNGETKPLKDNEYMPDLMHDHLVDFLTANKNKPFFVYYSLSHVHGEIQRTPDSKPDSKDLYSDNIAYMDKLVGKLMSVLDDLKLRENTLVVFFGDNGTAKGAIELSTIGGKALVGKKGTMEECGSLVPMVAYWPSVIKPGRVTDQLIDASDFLPTFAEIASASLPTKNVIDGKSFLPLLQGKKGNPRDWIFVELGNKWYVRDAQYKLDREGNLFDMSQSPFEEKTVAAGSKDKASEDARKKLQAVLDELNPAGGIIDNGDGSGRHAGKEKGKDKGKDKED